MLGSGTEQLCSGLSQNTRAARTNSPQRELPALSQPARLVQSFPEPAPASQPSREGPWLEREPEAVQGTEHPSQGCLQFSSLPTLLFAAPGDIKIPTRVETHVLPAWCSPEARIVFLIKDFSLEPLAVPAHARRWPGEVQRKGHHGSDLSLFHVPSPNIDSSRCSVQLQFPTHRSREKH